MEQSMYLAIMEFFALGLHCSTATDPRLLSSISPAFRECSNIRGTDPRDLCHLCHTVPSEIFSPQRRPRLIVDRSTVDGTKVSFDHDDELELFEKESCNESAESLHHDHNILHAGLKLSFGSFFFPEL